MYSFFKAMVQMLFFIRYRSQLKRIKPELIEFLENDIAASVRAAGGRTEAGRKMFAASFDENRIGFWLAVVILLEHISETLEKAEPDLFGYTLALGRNIGDVSAWLPRVLSSESAGGASGIWCSGDTTGALDFYVEFGASREIDTDGLRDSFGSVRAFKSFNGSLPPAREYPFREKIARSLARNDGLNTLLVGEEFLGKRDGIYRYCADTLGDVPPLVVRFGAGGQGLICIVDAWIGELRSFVADAPLDGEYPRAIAGLDAARIRLFGERLREEWSPGMKELCRDFVRSLLAVYTAAAKTRSSRGVLVLENLPLSGAALETLGDIYDSLEDKPLVIAENTFAGNGPASWGRLFPRVLKFPPEAFPLAPVIESPGNLPGEIWELAFIIFHLGRYFPASLLPRLFEEEGLSGELYHRAIRVLSSEGLFARGDPRPEIPGFESLARKTLGSGTGRVLSAVRNRILDWANTGKLRPCFRLLKILAELGEAPEPALTLRALKADVFSGTWEEIGEVIDTKYFDSLSGTENASACRYIFKTFRALVWRGRGEIDAAFREPIPALGSGNGNSCYSGCRVQVELNLASYYIGSGNISAASDAVRKAMLLNKELGKAAIPAYRFFALVNLSRQRIEDALEYISFALEQAGKSGLREELLLTLYFAASINLLYGNLSGAARLALRAEDTAAELGQTGWEKRARFLRGRICFETGRYGDALDIFRALAAGTPDTLREAGEPPGEAALMAATVNAWIFRTENFMEPPVRAGGAERKTPYTTPPFSGLDAALFTVEAACLAGEYEKAASLADGFLASDDEGQGDFNFTEQPDWRSGFYQCEYMYQPEKTPGTRVAMVYRALARCALQSSPETRAEILGGMQRFIREELLPDTDPRDSFYFYAWYRMLEGSRNPRDMDKIQVDMSTVVSLAYKRLRRRAARIDDTETREDFLSLPRWNKTLCLAAREYKVI